MYILPSCSSCTPTKLLPPYPTSGIAKLSDAKSRFLSTVERLEEQDPTTYKLLESIILTFIFSGDPKVLALGWECAIDNYRCATPNWIYEEMLSDPDNPVNWQGYQQ